MKTVLDIMTKSPAVCMTDTSVSEAARMMVEHDCGALPVVDSKEAPQLVGVLTDRDIVVRLVAAGLNPLEATAADAMSAGAATVAPGMTLRQAARVMEINLVRRAPVLDDHGSIIGIVSQADIALNAEAEETAELVQAVSEEEELFNSAPMGGAYSG